MIKTLDVTAQVRSLVPSIGERRVVMSAGSLAVCDNHDEAKRYQLVGGLAHRLLMDPACKRRPIDGRHTAVDSPIGPRFVLTVGASPDGEETLAIVTQWEWSLHGGAQHAPEIEVVEPDSRARGLVN